MHRANHQNTKHDSDIFANHMFELALEAQRLTLCMAAMSAYIEVHAADGVPAYPKGYMRAMSSAIHEDMLSPKEMNPLEW